MFCVYWETTTTIMIIFVHLRNAFQAIFAILYCFSRTLKKYECVTGDTASEKYDRQLMFYMQPRTLNQHYTEKAYTSYINICILTFGDSFGLRAVVY